MGIRCGSQVTVCECPVSLDTYSGCTHGCKYCFAQNKVDLKDVRPLHCSDSLRKFIKGKRTRATRWCDWEIPLHWGGMSDPFQPAERKHRASLECLKVFDETGYPFVVSTKGRLISGEPYRSILGNCNAVVQVSMACSRYDILEPGAPTFEERLKMLEELAPVSKRLIVRIQPYILDFRNDVIDNLKSFADVGVYGVIVEGLKMKRGKPGLVKVGGDWCYPSEQLESHFQKIRETAHENGLAFFAGENRLREMGDSTCCCGFDGLPGFSGNKFTSVNILAGLDPEPTETMMEPGTAEPFKAIYQDTASTRILDEKSFAEMVRFGCHNLASIQGAYRTEEETLAFTRWLKSTGITAKEVNELTGSFMASHYLCVREGGQSAVPTPDMFEKLKRSPKVEEIPGYIDRLVYGR